MTESTAEKDYVWLLNVIVSCNNEFQFTCIDRLMELYKLKYPDEIIDLYPKLMQQRFTQFESIKKIKEGLIF